MSMKISIKAGVDSEGGVSPAQKTSESGTKYTRYRTIAIDGFEIPEGVSNEGCIFGLHVPDGRYTLEADGTLTKVSGTVRMV